MDQHKADGCKIFQVRKKANGQWDEPQELPASINTGNSQIPRIMADGESLIFSSDKFPGNKGGMDLYMTRYVNGIWSKPTSLGFVNTESDDQYISVAALGRYITRDVRGVRRNEIMEYLIPDEHRPKGMMKLEGTITDELSRPVPAYISIVDLETNKRFYNGRPYADGTFLVYLMEGTKYEVSIDPEQDQVTFYSQEYDLTYDKIPQVERMRVILKPLIAGEEILLQNVSFKPFSSNLDLSSSAKQLNKFMRIIKANPNLKFEFQVLLQGYKQDSIQSDPDLTEVVVDSIHTTYDEIDTLGQLYEADTVLVNTTYHNDRTWQQAQALVDYFVSQGAKPENFGVFGNAIPATLPEEKKIIVKAAVRKK
jgi:hypothetical protein